MPTMTSCPSCSKQLKVPDELIGRQVKCPACGTTFTAGAGGAAAPVLSAASSPQGMGGDLSPGFPVAPKPVTGLMAPGIILLLINLATLAFAGVCYKVSGDVERNPEEVKKALDKMREDMTKTMPDDQKKEFNSQMDFVQDNLSLIYLTLAVLALVQALLSVPGAIQMIRSRRGGLGWLAAFMNVLPLSCCCIGGAPISIWAMVALYKAGKG